MRTIESRERTALADDRPLLAWYRTSFGAYALAVGLGGVVPLVSTEASSAYRALGRIFAVLGAIAALGGVWHRCRLPRAHQFVASKPNQPSIHREHRISGGAARSRNGGGNWSRRVRSLPGSGGEATVRSGHPSSPLASGIQLARQRVRLRSGSMFLWPRNTCPISRPCDVRLGDFEADAPPCVSGQTRAGSFMSIASGLNGLLNGSPGSRDVSVRPTPLG